MTGTHVYVGSLSVSGFAERITLHGNNKNCIRKAQHKTQPFLEVFVYNETEKVVLSAQS
jgi:Uri superfamily endonuclease